MDEDSESGDTSDSDSDNGIEYQKEPIYGTKYVKEKLNFALFDIDYKISDPPVNILFPNDLKILAESDADKPERIFTDKNMEIWTQTCVKFKVPTVIVVDNFYSNDCGILNTAEGRVFVQIWARVIREYFREYNYMAEKASMYFSCEFDSDGLEFNFRGYADKIEEFIYSCYNKLIKFDAKIHQHTFDMKKEEWLKDLKNYAYEDPSEQLNLILSKILISGAFTTKHMLAEGKNLTFEKFIELSDRILKTGRHLWF